jgi:hypothetical protein
VYNISITRGDNDMPRDYDFENFKKYAHTETMKFGDLANEIKELLVKSYLKGYEDCENDYHTFCGL